MGLRASQSALGFGASVLKRKQINKQKTNINKYTEVKTALIYRLSLTAEPAGISAVVFEPSLSLSRYRRVVTLVFNLVTDS